MRLVLLPFFVYAFAPQAPDSQVVFEVATVNHGRPGDYSAAVRGGPGTRDPTTYTVENYPMSSLLGIAYGINSYQLSGPGWLDDELESQKIVIDTVIIDHIEKTPSEN